MDIINMEIGEASQIDSAQTEIRSFMLRRHRLPATNEEAFQIRNLAEFQAMLTSTSQTMSSLLASIAVISLIVGGIWIMNTMLVSVTERTREIGLRKAVGAGRRGLRPLARAQGRPAQSDRRAALRVRWRGADDRPRTTDRGGG